MSATPTDTAKDERIGKDPILWANKESTGVIRRQCPPWAEKAWIVVSLLFMKEGYDEQISEHAQIKVIDQIFRKKRWKTQVVSRCIRLKGSGHFLKKGRVDGNYYSACSVLHYLEPHYTSSPERMTQRGSLTSGS